MRGFKVTQFKASSASVIRRELALAADRALWADEQNQCIAIIAQLYDLLDDLDHGLEPSSRSRIVAADTAAWVGDMGRCSELLGDIVA